MRKLARLLEATVGSGNTMADEKAGWEWLQADAKLVRFLVDHPDMAEVEKDPALRDVLNKLTANDGRKGADALWRLAAVAVAFLNGGRARAKGFGMAGQSQDQRMLGLEVEAEHTCPDAKPFVRALIQGRIGRDHNAEDEKYYYRGADGEAKVKGEK